MFTRSLALGLPARSLASGLPARSLAPVLPARTLASGLPACLAAIAFAFALPGCGEPAACDMQAQQGMPERPAELDRLSAWVGHWTGTGDMVIYTPEGEQKMTTTGTEHVTWACDRRFLQSTFSYGMGEMGEMTGVSMMTWCPDEKEYVSWYFDSFGGVGEAEMTYDAARGLWVMESEGKNPMTGRAVQGSGTVKMAKDNMSNEWNYVEKDVGTGKKIMEITGKSRKLGGGTAAPASATGTMSPTK